MENQEVSKVLSDFADLLEISGKNPFRVRAYRDAARTVVTQPEPLEKMIEGGEDLTELPGIGEDMSAHIQEILETGTMKSYEELVQEVPPSLIEIMKLPGVGPKKTQALWDSLGIETIQELKQAAEASRIEELEGFGQKTQQKILQGIEQLHRYQERFLLADVDQWVRPLKEYMQAGPEIDQLEIAGSYRRRKETVGDIDLLIICDSCQKVMDYFTRYSRIEEVLSAGETRGTVRLDSGLQVDIRILTPKSFGAALLYFTGSKPHSIRLRQRAIERGLRISEYGVFRNVDEEEPSDPWAGEYLAGREEEEVYGAVDLPWIPPELREDRGEIKAAEKGELPRIIQLEEIKGDVQMHSTWSDGKASIEEMVEECMARGYAYCAITDHSRSLHVAGGLEAEEVRRQWDEIDDINSRNSEFRLLRGMEVDILQDGSLDMEEDILKALDVVVVSVHSHFNLDPEQQTERIIRAIRHPHVHILAHPTGRIINKREPIQFDLDAVLEAARESGVAVELNAQPDRLDLNDIQLKMAKEKGVKVVINTDAHRVEELRFIRYGIDQARRSWLEPEDVLNTLPLTAFLKELKRKN